MLWVKQSTAVILKLGPFVDSTDAVTPETALSIAQADIQISKNGGAFAQTSDVSPTTTHDADGWYPIPLTATDTNTLGTIKVQVAISGALPVFAECMVLPAVTYDSLVAGSDTLDVNITSISGGGAAADALEAVFDGTGSLAAGLGLMESFELFGFVLYHGEIGTVTSQTEFTITGGEESVDDDAYNNSLAVIVDSANSKQKAVGLVSDYTGSTQTLFLASDPGIFTIASGDAILLLPLPSSIGSVTGNVGGIAGTIQTLDALDTAQDTQHSATQAAIAALNDFDPANDVVAHVTLVDTTTTNTDMRGTDSAYTGTPPTAAAIADAVWDEATSGHSTAGTTGKALTDILADTNELQTNQGNWLTATGFSTHSAADVWAVATRVVTAATNITSDGAAIATTAGVIDHVTLVDTTTTNTDMRGTDSAYTGTPPTASAIADQVWDEVASGHATAGTTGKLLSDAGAAGDPWSTAIPGAYSSGTAGYIVGTNLDAAVSGANTTTPPTAAAIADAVWDEATSGHSTAGTTGKALTDALADTNELQTDWTNGGRLDNLLDAAASAGAGSGARTIAITVDDGINPLQNAIVRMTEGANTYTLTTNASGQGTFNLDDATYTVAISKAGYTFAGTTLTVSADATPTYSMTAVAISAPANPAMTTAYLNVYDISGALLANETFTYQQTTAPTGTGTSFEPDSGTATSDANGLLQIPMYKDSYYDITRPSGPTATVEIPADAGSTYELPNMI